MKKKYEKKSTAQSFKTGFGVGLGVSSVVAVLAIITFWIFF